MYLNPSGTFFPCPIETYVAIFLAPVGAYEAIHEHLMVTDAAMV
jgi:hypothetical protein